MQTVRKYLVYEYVPLMVNTFRNDTRGNCAVQRSIHVILGVNEETRHYISQVINVLRYFNSQIILKCNLINGTKFQTSLIVFTFFENPSKGKIFTLVEK